MGTSYCYDCEEPQPVYQPLAICWEIEPCNEGCVETLSSDCIVVGKTVGPFVKGQSLTQALEVLSEYLKALGIEYNGSNPTQLIIYSFEVPNLPADVVVKRNTAEVINTNYTSANQLLTDLLALDLTWVMTVHTRLDGTSFYVFSVGGQANWEITIT